MAPVGYSWIVAEVTSYANVLLSLSPQQTIWFVWQVHISGYLFYMLGLKSTGQPEKFHFLRNLGPSKVVLSEPNSQPTSNLKSNDPRLFEIVRFNNWRHAATDRYITQGGNNQIFLVRQRHLAGRFRLEEI